TDREGAGRRRPLMHPLLERGLDVVRGAGVDLQILRHPYERLSVAGNGIGVVDPAVAPVVEEPLPARRCRRRVDGQGKSEREDGQPNDTSPPEHVWLVPASGRMETSSLTSQPPLP